MGQSKDISIPTNLSIEKHNRQGFALVFKKGKESKT